MNRSSTDHRYSGRAGLAGSRPAGDASQPSREDLIAAETLLERKISRSRRALVIERLWPRFWPPLAVGLVFVLVSLLGVWSLLGATGHLVLAGAFALAALLSLIPLARLSWPTRDDAIRRLEGGSKTAHRPVSSYEDAVSAAPAGGTTEGLWQAHRRRLAEQFRRLRVAGPQPRTDRYDPFALRALLLLVTALAAFASGDALYDRLTGSLRVADAVPAVPARLDAWVTPPVYTGEAPQLLLDGLAMSVGSGGAAVSSGPGQADGATGAQSGFDHSASRITVPEGSLVVVRAIGGDHASYTLSQRALGSGPEETVAVPRVGASPLEAARGYGVESSAASSDDVEVSEPTEANGGGAADVTASQTSEAPEAERTATEFRFKLDESTSFTLARDGQPTVTWQFDVTPDDPPVIDFREEPRATPRGALRLSYNTTDDYGVAAVAAEIALADPDPDDPNTATAKPVETLPAIAEEILRGEPPRMTLRLPRANPKAAEGSGFEDFADHPWSGRRVGISLSARDQAEQVGQSAAHVMELPARRFSKPLARALVEQRGNLFERPSDALDVSNALAALMLAGDRFIPDRVVYLGMRSAQKRLRFNQLPKALVGRDPTDEAETARVQAHYQMLRSVVDQLWSLALRLEDGDLSDAERALRQAQDALMQALEDGASDEEIQQLMQELREAMSRFLQSLQRQAEQGGQGQQQQNNQQLSSRDLDQMLRDIEQMARSGSRDAARQMLSELREMMEQLQAGRGGQQGGQQGQAMQTLEEFGDLIQQQQQLLDDTFRAQQGNQNGGQQGQQGQGQQGQGQQGQGQQGRGQQGQSGQGREGQGREGQGRGQGQGQGQGQGGFGQNGSGGQGQGLGQRQGDLRGRLQDLLRDLQSQGLGGNNATDPLGRAGEAMGDAEGSIQGGELGDATDSQGQALEQLRQGAQQLAEEMLQQMRQGQGQANARGSRDPLGRSEGTRDGGRNPFGGQDMVPGAIDAQRAREILEELRRRLSDPTRRPEELDYLERLLERF